MAEPDGTRGVGDDGEWTDLPPGTKAIPPEYYKRPGGCGFTGCMYAAMIFAALAIVFLVIGLLTREWIVPPVSPR
jgi:hypothetical protein